MTTDAIETLIDKLEMAIERAVKAEDREKALSNRLVQTREELAKAQARIKDLELLAKPSQMVVANGHPAMPLVDAR